MSVARCRVTVALVGGLLAALAAQVPARAGSAFLINGDGEPLAWDTAAPIVFNLDQGPLGQLSEDEAQALAVESFGIWAAVPTATAAFAPGEDLPCDVSLTTVLACGPDAIPIFGVGNDGISPYVFDTNGDILDLFLGLGARNDIIGLAVVAGGTFVPPVAAEGEALVNGRFFDGVDQSGNPESASREGFQAVMVHEIGHWLNLDHTQLNVHVWLDGDPDNEEILPTMFAAATDNDAALLTLEADDVATLAALYPLDRRDRRAPDEGDGWRLGEHPGAHPVPGSVHGMIYESDGVTPFQGANVVLRRVNDAERLAYSTTSGTRHRPTPPPGVSRAEFGGPPDPALRGTFDLGGIPPGSYTLEIEEINPLFTGGSAVGALLEPVWVPGPDEYWNGPRESSDPAVDDPADLDRVVVGAGRAVGGVDVILNEPPRAAILYVVDDEPFAPRDLGKRGTILLLDLETGQTLNRIPTGARSSALVDGLAYAPSRGTLFWTDGFGVRSIYELDPADGTVVATLPWLDGMVTPDGLAFLEGPEQPDGGLLYVLDSGLNAVIALDPDTGELVPDHSLFFTTTMFGGLDGSGDDLFVTTFGAAILQLRPGTDEPFVQALPKPQLEQFLLGLAFDGELLYATSILPPDFLVWQIDPTPATKAGRVGGEVDVLQAIPDPTEIVLGGFSAAAISRRADLNGDLAVDGADLAALSRAFATHEGEARYAAGVDLDRDGFVGPRDLAILAEDFGRPRRGRRR